MAWKDYFYFTSGQKIGIIILIVLIVLVSLSLKLMPYFFKKEASFLGDSLFVAEVEQFKASLVELDKKQQKKWVQYDNQQKKKKPFFEKANPTPKEKVELFAFDPNQADSLTLRQLGIKPYVVKNILKYRRKGGRFKSVQHFSRTYGLTKTKFEALKPYIKIEKQKSDFQNITKKQEKETPIKENVQEEIIKPLELNSTDTAQLVKIRGIGKYTANSIVYYRKSLGGYISVEQLKEVRGVTPENFEKIKAFFIVDTSKIEKINVNKASVEKLKRHPYIRYFTKAKAIYDYRRYKIKLEKIEDLEILNELTAEDIKRLKPYLTFE